MNWNKYLIHLIVILFYFARVDIYARHTDSERDFSNCEPGHIPCKIKNNDGFLKITCVKPRCEEITKVQEICLPSYSPGCTKGSWVGGIHREFVGNEEKPEYKTKCCSHPIMNKAVSIRPIADFFPGSTAADAASGQGDYIDIVTNVRPHSQFDHHQIEITSVMCHSTTSTRSTVTSRPTTQKPDDRHPKNNNNGGNNGGGGGGGGGGEKGHDGGQNGGQDGGHDGGHQGGSHQNSHECGPTGNCKNNPKLEGGNNAQYEKQNVPPPRPVSAANNDPKAWGMGGGGCFSADTLVQTRRGGKRMDEIRVGDEILSSISWDGNSAASYQPITQFIHQDPNVFTRYTVITTITGRSLSLTPNHLLPQFECHLLERDHVSVREYELLFTQSAKFASRAKTGQCVLVVDFDGRFVAEKISNVTSAVRRGVYSPITASGILVANGVQASCYSTVENHALQHAFFTFVRQMTSTWQPYVDYVKQLFYPQRTNFEKDDGQIPTLLRIMLVLSNMVMGSY